MLDVSSTSKDFFIKFSLNNEYCFLAYCNDLTILISLSASINNADAATPECFRNLFAFTVKSEISLKLDTPGSTPVNLVSNSNAVLT